jgi:hypothetical protein
LAVYSTLDTGAVENQVLNNVKEVAINEMIDAGQEELRLALEAGEVDSNGVGMITVIVDGAWSKRSYKTNYNALSGVASIIGARLKKVLYTGWSRYNLPEEIQ